MGSFTLRNHIQRCVEFQIGKRIEMSKIRLCILMGMTLGLAACGPTQGTENTITNNNQAPVVNVINDVSKLVSDEPSAEPSAEPTAEPTEEPSTEPSAEPLAEPSANPSASASSTVQNTCLFKPDDNGFLNVPYNGKDRVLKPGEYTLLNGGAAVRVTKANQPDTGKVYEKSCNTSNNDSSDIMNFCDKFPVKEDGTTIMVPYNGNVRYLVKGEYELQPDGRSVRITKPGAPDIGKIVTPPSCH